MRCGFINPDSVILAREKTDQCLQCRSNIFQPLIITFLNKCSTHIIQNHKSVNLVPFGKNLAVELAFLAFVADHYNMNEEELMDRVIRHLGPRGFGNVMEALGWTQEKFQEGFDLANAMQNLDLIKLLYSNFNQNNIVIEFTLLGKAKYTTLI